MLPLQNVDHQILRYKYPFTFFIGLEAYTKTRALQPLHRHLKANMPAVVGFLRMTDCFVDICVAKGKTKIVDMCVDAGIWPFQVCG